MQNRAVLDQGVLEFMEIANGCNSQILFIKVVSSHSSYYFLDALGNVGPRDLAATISWAFNNDGQDLLDSVQGLKWHFFSQSKQLGQVNVDFFYSEIKVCNFFDHI